jgi:hypothetical protein
MPKKAQLRDQTGSVFASALVAKELSTSIDWPETGFWEARQIGTDKSDCGKGL